VKLKCVIFVFLGLIFSGARMPAEVWAFVVEPSFTDAKIQIPIEGSNRTILTPARLVDGYIETLTMDEKKARNISLGEIRASALQTASDVLDGMTVEIARDKNNVVQYAAIESDDPLTASCVLAPDFAAYFRDILGPDLLVAMPHRYLVLVFSKQDDVHKKMSEFIINAYLSATWPVSREIFALENGTLTSLGVLE